MLKPQFLLTNEIPVSIERRGQGYWATRERVSYIANEGNPFRTCGDGNTRINPRRCGGLRMFGVPYG